MLLHIDLIGSFNIFSNSICSGFLLPLIQGLLDIKLSKLMCCPPIVS